MCNETSSIKRKTVSKVVVFGTSGALLIAVALAAAATADGPPCHAGRSDGRSAAVTRRSAASRSRKQRVTGEDTPFRLPFGRWPGVVVRSPSRSKLPWALPWALTSRRHAHRGSPDDQRLGRQT
jgi:hypothetical protein